MGSDLEVIDRRRVVVAALPLKRAARARLAAQLDNAQVVDIRDEVERADLVLAPSCSPQTISALKDAYPTARVVVVELEDWEFGIDLPGPVKRLLAAGADGYVTADSIAELAAQLLPADSQHPSVDEQAAVNSLPSASVDAVILSSLAERLRHRHPSERPTFD